MSDELEKQLRAACLAAIHGPQIEFAAVKYLDDLYKAIEAGELTWRDGDGPRGSRALNGTSPNYNVMVVQYNTGTHIDHAGMFTLLAPNAGINVIVIPKPFANWIFHKAQGARN